MSGAEYDIRGSGGRTFVRGTIHPPPGNSQPIAATFTASEVAARWDVGDACAMMEWGAVQPLMPILGVYATANTLDQNVTNQGLFAFTPGATTDDVFQAQATVAFVAAFLGGGPYADSLDAQGVVVVADLRFGVVLPGAVGYVMLSGDAAPTTGSITVTLLA